MGATDWRSTAPTAMHCDRDLCSTQARKLALTHTHCAHILSKYQRISIRRCTTTTAHIAQLELARPGGGVSAGQSPCGERAQGSRLASWLVAGWTAASSAGGASPAGHGRPFRCFRVMRRTPTRTLSGAAVRTHRTE